MDIGGSIHYIYTYPFAYSHTWIRGYCRARSSFGCVSAHALRLTALDWQKNIRPAVRWRSGCVFPLDLARPGNPETLSGRSGARFSKPERRFLCHSSLRICTLLHDLLTLTKHCVGARISSFGLVARVPTSGENSLRTLLGEGLALATRSTRARKQPKRANLALEIANLAPRTAAKAAKTANLAAKTAQLGVPRPFQTRPGASPSRPRVPKPPKIKISSIFHRFSIDFSVIVHGLRTVPSASSLLS